MIKINFKGNNRFFHDFRFVKNEINFRGNNRFFHDFRFVKNVDKILIICNFASATLPDLPRHPSHLFTHLLLHNIHIIIGYQHSKAMVNTQVI